MSHGIIGFDAYEGLFTKAQFQAGKGRSPGTRVNVQKGGSSKEFVAVKLASGNWSNGCLVQLNSAGVNGTATTVSAGAGVADVGQALGLLTFSSSSAIQTMAGTAYGYALVYGEGKAQVASSTVLGMALTLGASAGVLGPYVVDATASSHVVGINLGTTSASTQAFVPVFVNYPKFVVGPKDD
jgi:hypothetical protein